MFTLDHLSPTEFEEFAYDLLCSLGYKNLSWRKGTGLDASPSDQGRDLEAEEDVKEPDGTIRLDRWFVECKHYKRGIPPTELQGALTWANANAPDYLLFICSNFLSNPAKENLEQYEKQNKPSFKIRVWERKKLEELCVGKLHLLQKYKLSADIQGLDLAHPNHLTYVLSPQLNSLEFLIESLDQLNPELRDKAFSNVYLEVVNPRYRKPNHLGETFGDLKVDPVNYESFKESVRRRSKTGNDISIVHNVVSWTLSWLLHCGNPSTVIKAKEFMHDAKSHFIGELEVEDNKDRKKNLKDMLTWIDKAISTADSRTKESYELYTYICDNLIPRLLTEKY